jgi:hypothetical protein
VLKNRLLWNKYVPGREEGDNCIMRSSTDTYSSTNILRGDQKDEEMGCGM